MAREDIGVPSRADRVLTRIRDVPPGFVRAYGDVSPGGPRFAGSVLAGWRDPPGPGRPVVAAGGLAAVAGSGAQVTTARVSAFPMPGTDVAGPETQVSLRGAPAEALGA